MNTQPLQLLELASNVQKYFYLHFKNIAIQKFGNYFSCSVRKRIEMNETSVVINIYFRLWPDIINTK